MLDQLSLNQLRILVAVIDTGSFSAAARKLARVQSAISQSIHALEDELGVTLFDRTARRPTLTDAGRVIVEEARQILRSVDMLKERSRSIAGGIDAELALAVEQIIPSGVLMESINDFSASYPALPVTLFTEGLAGACEQRLLDGLVTIAIYSMFGEKNDEIEGEFLAAIPILPVVAPGHPLASVPHQIDKDELDRHIQLVMTDRAQLTSSIAAGTAFSQRAWRFADSPTRYEYLLKGFGWTHMPLYLAEGHIREGRLKFLDLKHYDGGYVSLPLHVVYQRSRKPGRAGLHFIKDLRRRLAKRGSVSELLGRDVPEISIQMLPLKPRR